MNINNLYPTDTLVPVGSTAGQFTDKLTARIPSLSPLTQEAYWLGYISYDNLPLIMQHSKLYYSDEDTVVIENDTVVDNYPCGYIDGVIRGGIYMEDDIYISNNYYQYIRFLNDLHPEYSAAYLNANTAPVNATSIYFLYYVTINDEVTAKDLVSPMPGFSINFNNSENGGLVGMMEFMQGLRTITITLGQLTFDITIEDDLYETGHAQIVSNEDPSTVMDLFINTMNLPNRGYINGTTSGDYYTAFAAKVKYEDEDETHSYNVVLHSIENQLRPLVLYKKSQYGQVEKYTYNDEGITHGLFYSTGAAGTFSATALNALNATTQYLYDGNLVAYAQYGSGGTNKQAFIAMVMPGKDLYKIFSLYMPRVDVSANATSVQASYINNVTYATDVSSDDEFLARLKTGDIGNQTFKDDLRPWQYSSTLENDFLEDDVPPYGPEPEPGPIPQETEPKYPGFPTLGPSTRYIPTAGVNFYALNSSLVTDFVQRLWSQPKSFYEAIQIAGNQVDSIFDYIQSFRYYPLKYDFSSEDSYPVIFGTGAVLKEANGDTNFQLRGTPLIQNIVTAGEWNLNASIYHWRNNFLDYSPYLKMSIYLPFAGTIELSPEAVASHTDISAATISLLASFDIETGTITYYVVNQANVILAQKTAKVAIDLPLSGNNSAEQSASILRAQFSTIKQLLGAGSNIVSGAATSGLVGAAAGAVSTLGSLGDMYLQNSLAQRAIPVEVQGMGGTFSALAGGQYPYITINRQKVSNPPNYAHTTGYLVEGTYRIGNLNGLTVCRNVDVSGIGQATDKEKAQIKQILESGFYA